MSANTVVVQGVVKPDGTLELEGKLPLPVGKVQVTVQPLPELPADDPFWQRMQAIWDGQKTRDHVPCSIEEVERDCRRMREESGDPSYWETNSCRSPQNFLPSPLREREKSARLRFAVSNGTPGRR